jgi:hypothetical protein
MPGSYREAFEARWAMSRDSLDEWIDKALEADPLPMVEVDVPEHGPPLTDSELRCAQDHLSKWQAPPDFINATKALCERCLSKDWFRSPRLKFLHNAYVLADFVRLQHARRAEAWQRVQGDFWGKDRLSKRLDRAR